MDKITEAQKYIMDQTVSKDDAHKIETNCDRSFENALKGIILVIPDIIEKMNQLSYKELASVQTLIFLEGQETEYLRKKREGTLKLITKELEDIDYECAQCNVKVEDHLSIGNKPIDELKKLIPKIGGSISWRLYNKISRNETLRTGATSVETIKEDISFLNEKLMSLFERYELSNSFEKKLNDLWLIVGTISDDDLRSLIDLLEKENTKNDEFLEKEIKKYINFLRNELTYRYKSISLINNRYGIEIKNFRDFKRFMIETKQNVQEFKKYVSERYTEIPCVLLCVIKELEKIDDVEDSTEDIAEKILDEMDINTDFPKELIADDLDPLFETIGKLEDGELKEVIKVILQKSEQNGQIPLYEHCVSFLNNELRKRRDLLYLIKTKVRNVIETYDDLYEYLVDKDTSLPIFKLFINQHLKEQKIPCALLYCYHLAFHNQEPFEKPEPQVVDRDGTLGQLYNKEKEKDAYNQNIELIEKCKSEEYKEVFGNLYMRLPAGIHLTDKGKELALLSDSQLKYIINENKDDEDKVKYESFELQLREIFYKKYKGNNVHEIVTRIVTNKHNLNNFGRGTTLVWPLSVVYELEKKIEQFMKKTKFENEVLEDTHDSVEKPKHYMFNIDGYDVQAIDIVRGLLTPEEFRGWIKGSYFTYLMRADRKNGIEDLEKAKTFLNWQIQLDNEEELSIPGKNDEK